MAQYFIIFLSSGYVSSYRIQSQKTWPFQHLYEIFDQIIIWHFKLQLHQIISSKILTWCLLNQDVYAKATHDWSWTTVT